MSSPPAKRKRVRTETQMEQKRLADRIKHRENRHENKTRLDNIENDISDIKSALQSLTLHLQAPTPALPPPAFPHTTRQELSLAPSPRSNRGAFFETSMSPTQPVLSMPHIAAGHVPNQQAPWSLVSLTHAGMSRRRIDPKLLNCQCGSPHYDRFDCIDRCTITSFYQHQITFPAMRGPAGFLPRNPSLPAMMLHDMEENVATFLITGFLRQYRNKGIAQLLSFYLLGYRYMRWQMNPCEETLRDVPSWLLPTDTQKLNPHSVVVDYIPWPRLRDYLCIGGDDDPQRSLNLYLESMQFSWPPEQPLFDQGDGGQMTLSAEFEAAVCELGNWHLGPPWSEAFPHLVDLVRPL